MAKVCLSRSGTAPITIQVQCISLSGKSVDHDVSDTLYRLLAAHCARWRTVALIAAPALPVMILKQLIGNLLLLETVMLKVTHYSQARLLGVIRSAPKLRNFIIAGIREVHVTSLPWYQLTRLSGFAIGVYDCLALLQQTPNISLLDVHFQPVPTTSIRIIPHIHLAFLNRLNITCNGGELLGSFFDHLTFPSLDQLSFGGILDDATPTFASMLARSSTLKPVLNISLALPGAHPPWHVVQIMEVTPNVENLTVAHNETIQHLTAVDEVLNLFIVSDGRRLLPKMQTFAYRSQWPPGIGNGVTLVDMIKSRRRVGSGDGISQLLS